MKQYLTTAVLSFFLLQTATAQQIEPGPKRFGAFAGANFSHINFAKGVPPPTSPIKTSVQPGVHFGFFMLVHITGDLYFQPEYSYSQMGGKVKDSDSGYKVNYFSLPLFLRYQLSEQFALMAGPQFDLLINAKKTINGSSANITHDTEERSLAATAGIEYEITPSLFISAKYMYGLNHIGFGQRSDVREFKYEMAQITAGVKF